MHSSDLEPRGHSSKPSSKGDSNEKGFSTIYLSTPPKDEGLTLASKLRAVAKGKAKAQGHDPKLVMQEATLWLNALQESMEEMANLTPQQQANLTQLKEKAKTATKEYATDPAKVSKTNWAAASLMYWLSFAPGKIVTNTVAGALTAVQMTREASFAPWINTLGVPLIQVLFAEPLGGARRNDGQSYTSPDGAAYSNYQTAHALLIRAWIEGNREDIKKYKGIMGQITEDLIKREQKLYADGTRRIPLALTSGATSTANVGTIAPVDWARLRSFLADEVPIHTFSLLNGITGSVSLLWPTLMPAAWARAPDAGAHVLMGNLAMVWMFDAQNRLRKIVQGASLSHGADEEVLAIKRAEPAERLRIWTEQKAALSAMANELRTVVHALQALINKPPNDSTKKRAEKRLLEAEEIQRMSNLYLVAIDDLQARAQRDTENWSTGTTRICGTFTNTMSSFMGETDKQPVKWLDGSPIVVRNLSKVLGYTAALAPAAVHAMMLAQRLLEPNVPGHDTDAPHNTTLPGMHAATPGDYVMASTVALTAICGWTMRNLVCVPAFEHMIHASIGLGTQVVQQCTALCKGEADEAPKIGNTMADPDKTSSSGRDEVGAIKVYGDVVVNMEEINARSQDTSSSAKGSPSSSKT